MVDVRAERQADGGRFKVEPDRHGGYERGDTYERIRSLERRFSDLDDCLRRALEREEELNDLLGDDEIREGKERERLEEQEHRMDELGEGHGRYVERLERDEHRQHELHERLERDEHHQRE